MKIAVHLRPGENRTNDRLYGLTEGFQRLGHTTLYAERICPVTDSDLVVQVGFARTNALLDAIEREIPYIIVEAPFWRDYYDTHDASSWGYNGLAGGAWAPPPPHEFRRKPPLLPLKTGDKTLIIGQKPTDHSLRGSDHVQWIVAARNNLPDADFRPHPLMVPPGSLLCIYDELRRYDQVVTFTSTVAVEALRDGLKVVADHRYNLAFGVDDREAWHHTLSWRQSENDTLGELAPYILSGYEEARERAERGLVEIPRHKVDPQAIDRRYYQEIDHGDFIRT